MTWACRSPLGRNGQIKILRILPAKRRNEKGKRREKTSVRSELDNIPGIGPETKRRLLTAFRSVSKIRNADVHELGKLIGDKKAQILADHLKKRG